MTIFSLNGRIILRQCKLEGRGILDRRSVLLSTNLHKEIRSRLSVPILVNEAAEGVLLGDLVHLYDRYGIVEVLVVLLDII